MDTIELDENDKHPYLSVRFEDFDADVVFSESWKKLAKSSNARRQSMFGPNHAGGTHYKSLSCPAALSPKFEAWKESSVELSGHRMKSSKAINMLHMETNPILQILNKRERGETITKKEATLLWKKREELRTEHPYSLPALVEAVSKHAKKHFRDLYMLLRGWDTPSVSDALELMGCDDSFVRAYAVQEFDFLASDNTLTNYMLQLTQALKAEPFHDSALARFLLRRAIANPARVGHCLYWALAADCHIKGCAHRFELLKNTYLRHCGKYR
jgi:hypothetical protein